MCALSAASSWFVRASGALAVTTLLLSSVAMVPSEGRAAVRIHVVVEAGSPALSPPVCPYCAPPRVCVPSNFLSDEPQPIFDSPLEAYGACSDGVIYFATLEDGVLSYFGQIEEPFGITIAEETDVTYMLAPFYIERECDAETLGLPGPIASPCRLLSVRLTDLDSHWHYEDFFGDRQFTLIGAAPTARLPEPAFAPGLGVAISALLIAAKARRPTRSAARRKSSSST